jgi:hypothetical protein
MIVCGLAGACAPRAATTVAVSLPAAPVAGAVSGTTYTAPDGAFRVAVPTVFVTGQAAVGAGRLHEGLRLEDGRGMVEGARVDYVMFGPSVDHDDEIYHVVLAAPDPYRRYDDLARHADAIITGYLEQYDQQYVGASTELVRKDVELAGRPAVYASYRYDFVRRSTDDATRLRSYVSFCILAAQGYRLVTTVVERRPASVPSEEADGREKSLEHQYREGSCDGQWLASLELDAPATTATSSLAFRNRFAAQNAR